jgi:hypothetical protein
MNFQEYQSDFRKQEYIQQISNTAKNPGNYGNTESGGIFDPVQMGFAGRQVFARFNFKF